MEAVRKFHINQWMLAAETWSQAIASMATEDGANGERKTKTDGGAATRYDYDALGRLALEGLVIRRARSGTLVAPLDLAAKGKVRAKRGPLTSKN